MQSICGTAISHLHADELILTYGASVLAELFLKTCASRKYRLILVEGTRLRKVTHKAPPSVVRREGRSGAISCGRVAEPRDGAAAERGGHVRDRGGQRGRVQPHVAGQQGEASRRVPRGLVAPWPLGPAKLWLRRWWWACARRWRAARRWPRRGCTPSPRPPASTACP